MATGVMYDEGLMLEHKSLWEDHPERPERLSSILTRCRELELLSRCKALPPRFATEHELLKKHTVGHVRILRDLCEQNVGANSSDYGPLEEFAKKFGGHSYYHPNTYKAALLAAGSTIDLCHAILKGEIRNGMALVRPPGHHAMQDEYCGYCYFNNVALAAAQLLESGAVGRILIVDWDVHHGQATQQMFYDDPRVLYFSVHRYEHGVAWPNLRESNFDWIGGGGAAGFNCNVPLNKIRMGNAEYLAIWHQILLPMAYQFQPDIVLVSAGYDAALNDPLGEMRLTPQCYAHLLLQLTGCVPKGRVAVVLEGGYDLRALSEGAALTLRALIGDAPCPAIPPVSSPMPEICETIRDVCTMLGPYWKLGLGPEPDAATDSRNVHVLEPRFDASQTAGWVKPVEHPSRDPHPVHLHHVWSVFGEELNDLIVATDLSVPKYRIGIACGDEADETTEVEEEFQELGSSRVATLEHKEALIEAIVGGPKGARSVQSGVVYFHSFLDVSDIMGWIVNSSQLKRVLHVHVNANTTHVPTAVGTTCLRVSLCVSNEDFEDGGLRSLLTFVSRVLPIAYEFGPDFVLITDSLAPGVGVLGSKLVSHFVHLLSGLANGKLLLLTGSKENALQYCKIALGSEALPVLTFKANDGGGGTDRRRRHPDAKIEAEWAQWTMLKPLLEKRIPDKCEIPIGHY